MYASDNSDDGNDVDIYDDEDDDDDDDVNGGATVVLQCERVVIMASTNGWHKGWEMDGEEE